MKTVTIHNDKIKNIFEELTLGLGGKIIFDSDEYALEINNDFAKGSIVGSSFSDAISCLQFDMIFSEDVKICIGNPNISPVYFAYCSKGNLSHSFGVSGIENCFGDFESK